MRMSDVKPTPATKSATRRASTDRIGRSSPAAWSARSYSVDAYPWFVWNAANPPRRIISRRIIFTNLTGTRRAPQARRTNAEHTRWAIPQATNAQTEVPITTMRTRGSLPLSHEKNPHTGSFLFVSGRPSFPLLHMVSPALSRVGLCSSVSLNLRLLDTYYTRMGV